MFSLNLDDIPVVSYGKDPSLRLTAKGTSKTYTKTDMCGPPASLNGFSNPGYIHDVLLTNLTPSSDYFYSYGSSKVRESKLIDRISSTVLSVNRQIVEQNAHMV